MLYANSNDSFSHRDIRNTSEPLSFQFSGMDREFNKVLCIAHDLLLLSSFRMIVSAEF